MKPFLLISSRAEEAVAAEEHQSYCRLTGLDPSELEWRRIEQEPLGEIHLREYSGIILAGSPYTVSEPAEKKTAVELRVEEELSHLLDEVIARDFPFLGVCYGIGTIGAHQGATVDRTYGEPVRVSRIHLTEDGQADLLFRELPDDFDAFVGHKEALSDVPAHFTVLASSKDCPVQAFRLGNNVYATQFHPELERTTFATRVRAYANNGYYDPRELDSIIQSVEHADVRGSHMVLSRFIERYLSSAPVTT